MHSFLYGIFGGILIGLSAAILLLWAGEMMGACGIVSALFLSPKAAFQSPAQHWRLVLLASFCFASNLWFASDYHDDALARLSPYAFLLGGVLVGFGTKLGNGCTSGHGICGLARFSTRSMASVGTFMVVGIVTAILTQEETTPFNQNVFGWLRNEDPNAPLKLWPKAAATIILFIGMAAFLASSCHERTGASRSWLTDQQKKVGPACVTGTLFAVGLYVSRMVFPSYVFGFLNLGLLAKGGSNWDPTLMFVMGGGVTVSLISYQLIEGFSMVLPREKTLSKPILLSEGSKFCIPNSYGIDKELVIGAFCFGLGWGITGLCPGPAIFLASIGTAWVMVCYWPAFLLGTYFASLLQRREWLGISASPNGCNSCVEPMQCSNRTCIREPGDPSSGETGLVELSAAAPNEDVTPAVTRNEDAPPAATIIPTPPQLEAQEDTV